MAQGNAQAVGKAVIVYGSVKAVSASGLERVLGPNSIIYADEHIVTGPDGSVSIAFTDNPTQLILGRMSDVAIDEDVYSASTTTEIQDQALSVEDIQKALEQDPDFLLRNDFVGVMPLDDQICSGNSSGFISFFKARASSWREYGFLTN